MQYNTYRTLTSLFSPVIGWWLRLRLLRGKEDRGRFPERFGYTKHKRPEGVLVWVHAASVGEVNSVLPLIALLQEHFPHVGILLTSGTVSSARLVESYQQKGMLANVFHQYAPVDTPESVNRFFRNFRPDIGFWVESELWPNLVVTARARGCFMVIINGRMSQRSFDSWQARALSMMLQMMACFEVVFAQSEADAQRFRALGAKDTRVFGNIKYDAMPLACNESELFALQQKIGSRPVWLAASTHENEELIAAQAHKILSNKYPDLLTIIAPRHPPRGAELAAKLAKYGKVAQRSRGEQIDAKTDFYLADTLGELGIFYRLCEVVFMGGSIAERGGQNPLEPLRLRCAIIAGKHTQNFAEMYNELDKLDICQRVADANELAMKIDGFFQHPDALTAKQAISKEWLTAKSGATARIVSLLAPIFAPID